MYEDVFTRGLKERDGTVHDCFDTGFWGATCHTLGKLPEATESPVIAKPHCKGNARGLCHQVPAATSRRPMSVVASVERTAAVAAAPAHEVCVSEGLGVREAVAVGGWTFDVQWDRRSNAARIRDSCCSEFR